MIREEVRKNLPQYLAKFGIDSRERKRFRCISPTHPDVHPACNVIPGANLYHCYGCGVTGDIFDAAAAKENKPLTGRGFMTDNLMYLAKMFDVALPEMDLSDEEMYLIDARRAYAQAAAIVVQSGKSEVVAAKLKEYGWPEEVLRQIGIGSVKYEDYIGRMTGTHGHTLEFLKGIALDKKAIFNERNLIFTLKDEHGSPVAFSARNLEFEAKKVVYTAKREAIQQQDLSQAAKDELISALWKPTKYFNSPETVLFKKSQTLLNFDKARRAANHALLVFEGNADCTTMVAGGIKTAVATCGTTFTQEHLEMALAYGITKIVLVFDPDKAGERGTERFVKMLEEFGNRPGLEVEVIAMPGTSDPDAYVRAFGDLKTGVAEFRKLPRTDLFSWKLKKQIDEGADPLSIAASSLPDIVNIENNIDRLRRADRLAAGTGLPREFVHRELLRLIDGNEMKAEEEKLAIVNHAIKALQQSPKAVDAILASTQVKLDSVAGAKIGYNPVFNQKAFDLTVTKVETKTSTDELLTGFPVFDGLMGGIPKEGVMISVPGKPHHGKSIWMDNLIVRLLDHNPTLQVFLHHVDDAALLRIPRLLGVMSGLSSRDIANAGASLASGDAEFEERYTTAREKMRGWITDERLILADQSMLVGDLIAHERWIKEIRRRNSRGPFVSIGDNFHLFDLPGMEPGEGKVREMSKFISSLPTKHGITTMFSMELPKDILRPGIRPKYTDSKNSGGIAFDSKVNMGIFQELQDLKEESMLTWKSADHMMQIVDPSGHIMMAEKTLPIVEVIVDKNKQTGAKKAICFRLEPMSGRMEECSVSEQIHYKMLRNRPEASPRKRP